MAGKVQIPTRSFDCKSCGAPVRYHALPDVRATGCAYCGAIIDVTNEQYRLLSEAYAKKDELLRAVTLPLGKRGTFRGVSWEVIGAVRRGVTYEGMDYDWTEHLLWNPFEGFRWISEYQGHFSFIRPCPGVPSASTYDGRTYRLFQRSTSYVRFVLGELTWKVQRGDAVKFADHIDPPFMLSSEEEGGEVTWSMGEYVEPEEVQTAFALERVPARVGIFPTQPNPRVKQGVGKAWLIAMAAAIVVNFFVAASAGTGAVESGCPSSIVAFMLLSAYPIVTWFRKGIFETERWAESDVGDE